MSESLEDQLFGDPLLGWSISPLDALDTPLDSPLAGLGPTEFAGLAAEVRAIGGAPSVDEKSPPQPQQLDQQQQQQQQQQQSTPPMQPASQQPAAPSAAAAPSSMPSGGRLPESSPSNAPTLPSTFNALHQAEQAQQKAADQISRLYNLMLLQLPGEVQRQVQKELIIRTAKMRVAGVPILQGTMMVQQELLSLMQQLFMKTQSGRQTSSAGPSLSQQLQSVAAAAPQPSMSQQTQAVAQKQQGSQKQQQQQQQQQQKKQQQQQIRKMQAAAAVQAQLQQQQQAQAQQDQHLAAQQQASLQAQLEQLQQQNAMLQNQHRMAALQHLQTAHLQSQQAQQQLSGYSQGAPLPSSVIQWQQQQQQAQQQLAFPSFSSGNPELSGGQPASAKRKRAEPTSSAGTVATQQTTGGGDGNANTANYATALATAPSFTEDQLEGVGSAAVARAKAANARIKAKEAAERYSWSTGLFGELFDDAQVGAGGLLSQEIQWQQQQQQPQPSIMLTTASHGASGLVGHPAYAAGTQGQRLLSAAAARLGGSSPMTAAVQHSDPASAILNLSAPGWAGGMYGGGGGGMLQVGQMGGVPFASMQSFATGGFFSSGGDFFGLPPANLTQVTTTLEPPLDAELLKRLGLAPHDSVQL